MTYVVSEKFPEKEALIRARRRAPVLDDLGIDAMLEISRTPNKLLKKASDDGLFDDHVTSKAISRGSG